MPRRLGVLSIVVGAGVMGCTDATATAPSPPRFEESLYSNCREDGGIEFCIDRERYAPSDWVRYSISNRTPRRLFEDMCSGGTDGRRHAEEPWGQDVHATGRACAFFVSHEDRLANMVRLPQGRVRYDSMWINYAAVEGQWRLWVSILDLDGRRIRDAAFTSPIFPVER